MTDKLRGSEAGKIVGKIQGDLRQYRRKIIGDSLGPEEAKLYNASMDNFSVIRSNREELSGLLERDVTAKTIVGQFFKGGANKERVTALKALVGEDSPQWGSLKEAFVQQLTEKHMNPNSPTGFNSKAFLNDLTKSYGDDFVSSVLNTGKNGPNLQTVKNLLTVGDRLEATFRKVKPEDASDTVKKGMADLVFSVVGNLKSKGINAVQTLGSLIGASGNKESRIMEVFNREGFEKYLQGYRGRDKGRIAEGLETVLGNYNNARGVSKNITEIGKDLGQRAIKGNMRNRMQEVQ